jgi:adenosylhomocysteine nucleosidase
VIAAGFCGALAPHLKVGDVVTSPHILSVDHMVCDPAEKKRLFEQSGALAVDMESAAVAAVCAEHHIPFLAVRAVSDTSDTRLSPAVERVLARGEVSAWAALLAILRRPSALGEFRRLARDTKLAAEKLADELARIVAESAPPAR